MGVIDDSIDYGGAHDGAQGPERAAGSVPPPMRQAGVALAEAAGPGAGVRPRPQSKPPPRSPPRALRAC